MYFKQFPVIFYPVVLNGTEQYIQLKDITVNIRFVKEFLSNITLYDEYNIVDGDTPEIISEKIYGVAQYHWIIMIANDRYNYTTDFPLTYPTLVNYTKEKYNLNFSTEEWTIDGNDITVTRPNHGILASGSLKSPTTYITVTGNLLDGETTNSINGTYAIISNTTDTFTFSLDSSPAGIPEGSINVTTIGLEDYLHHYEDENGNWVPWDYPLAIPISNLTYEDKENESKRTLKIISKEIIERVASDFVEIFRK